MKRKGFLITIMMLFCGIFVMAQSSDEIDNIMIFAAGEGATEDEAKVAALQSVHKKLKTAFSSPGISYVTKEDQINLLLSYSITENKSIVAMQVPTSIVYKNQTSSSGFSGTMFANKMKVQDLEKENEKEALRSLVACMATWLPTCYDLQYKIQSPQYCEKDPSLLDLNIIVYSVPNKTATLINQDFYRFLRAISLSKEELAKYQKSNVPTTYLEICELVTNSYEKPKAWEYCGVTDENPPILKGFLQMPENVNHVYYFRNDDNVVREFLNLIYELSLMATFNAKVEDNLGGVSQIDLADLEVKWPFKVASHNAWSYEKQYSGKCTVTDFYNPNVSRSYGNVVTSGDLDEKYPLIEVTDRLLRFRLNFGTGIILRLHIPKTDIGKYTKFDVQKKSGGWYLTDFPF